MLMIFLPQPLYTSHDRSSLHMSVLNIHRYHTERKKAGFKARLKACLLCRCRLRCCCRKQKKRANSYICVLIGVGSPDGQVGDVRY